jgi:AcrR family transcriptional regulator
MNAIAVLEKDEAIRVEVIKAARDLFQRYGLLKTTMEDIARAAGKGKSTLYYYYKSKDEIFEAILKEDMDEVFETVKRSVEDEATAEGKLKTFTVARLKSLDQKVNLYSIVVGEVADNPKLIKKNKKDYEFKEGELLRSILTFGISNGEFKSIGEDDLDSIVYVMLCAIRGVERGLLEDNKIKKLGDRVGFILDILMNGIIKH